MGIAISIIGLLVGLFAFLSAVTMLPATAPQQLVQGLYYVVSLLGLILFALGWIAHRLKPAGDAKTES